MTPSTFLFLIALAPSQDGELALGPPFGEHMVLQRDTDVTIFGRAAPGAEVALVASWIDAPTSATADAAGAWSAVLRTSSANEEQTLVVRTGDLEIALTDVLLGEVWIASGQSNMEWPLRSTDDGEADIAAADQPRLRLFDVAHAPAAEPQTTCIASWSRCTPETATGFSAVAYHFGRELSLELDANVGLVGTNFGGSAAEAWVDAPALHTHHAEFDEALVRMARDLERPTEERTPLNNASPSALWNGMVAPLLPLSIRGVIWYQGETNRPRYAQYRELFPTLIRAWRDRFGQGELPFYFVQIAPFAYPDDVGEAALLREAQALTLRVPHTGMAVTMDIGDPDDIHPRNKRDVAHRLARLALARTYGREGLVCEGPTFASATREGSALRVAFEYAEGLDSWGEEPGPFTLAGEDRVFHPATARIEGATVVVESEAVPDPVAVRYAWGAADAGKLWNAAALPASSFRSDDWELKRED